MYVPLEREPRAALFEGLPAPATGSLTIYVFGPGFGESQVVALPDGRWMVVDSCVHHGVNLPLELLRHFEVPAIDLLAVTHGDLDHYKGLPEVVAHGNVKYGWRCPGLQTAREILLDLEKTEPEPGFAEALRMLDALDPLMKKNSFPPVFLVREYRRGSGYKITAVAPCSAELAYDKQYVSRLFKRLKRGEKLTRDEKRQLMGEANRLSLALVVWWNSVGILLGGDVEHDQANPDRGWGGVIRELTEDGQLSLIQGLRMVKTAHHGSDGAFSEEAWACHAAGDLVELAVVTRFNRGKNPPPHASGLAGIQRYARQLVLTSEPSGGWQHAVGEQWVRVAHPAGPGAAACVAITLSQSPPATVALSSQAALFQAALPQGAAPAKV